MMDLTISEGQLATLREALLSGEGQVERCAVLFASQVTRTDGRVRLLVREVIPAERDDYACQLLDRAVLRPEFVARTTKRARQENLAMIFAHSHPGSTVPHFSPVDAEGERRLAGFLSHRHSTVTHGALVMGDGGLCGRQLGADTPMRVVSLGENRTVAFDPDRASPQVSETYDRQVRAFGRDGQRVLQGLSVGIVGLGGTGSIVAQQLVHLGVRKFILIDPDVIEPSNLNRVVGSVPGDVGASKVAVAWRQLEAIAPDAHVQCIQGDIIRARTARGLTDADLIFGCTDSHGSRAVLQQVAYQYLIPCIDMGSTITTANGSVTGVFGRVQLLSPGLGCFTCSDLLNAAEVRRDMMSAYERRLDPYLQGMREPAPAVISLNGTVASLAVTLFMAYVTGLPSPARYLIYNAQNSTLRPAHAKPRSDCYICSQAGTLARGDSRPLYARAD